MKSGWAIVPMGELCSIKSGKSDTQDAVEDGPYAFFDRSRKIKRSSRFLFDCEALIIPGEGTEFLPKHFVGKFDLHQRAYALYDFSERIDVKYLYYFLHHLREHLPQVAVGATVKSLRLRHFEQLPVAVTSLADQQRIVGILDEAFERATTAEENTRHNLLNARAIVESYLQAILAKGGDGWVRKRLGEVSQIARGGSPRPIKNFLTTATDGVNWVKISDATASGKYIFETEQRIIPAGVKRSRLVRSGDFLLSNSMSFGRPYVMRTTGCIHDGWLVLTDYASHLDQDYLYYVLGSQMVFEQFDRLAAGSTVRNLNIELASRVNLPIPPLEKQKELARKLDAMSTETQRLAAICEQKLLALTELKDSLLRQAFTGQL